MSWQRLGVVVAELVKQLAAAAPAPGHDPHRRPTSIDQTQTPKHRGGCLHGTDK